MRTSYFFKVLTLGVILIWQSVIVAVAVAADTDATTTEDYKIIANEVLIENDVVQATGNVSLFRDDLTIYAPSIMANNENNSLFITDEYDLFVRDLVVHGWYLSDQDGLFVLRNYNLRQEGNVLQNRGEEISGQFIDDYLHADLVSGELSSCPADKYDWHFTYQQAHIDEKENAILISQGEFVFAALGTISVEALEVAYDRSRPKSGWLTPQVNYSKANGAELGLSYYQHISDQLDFTFSPQILHKRGFALDQETRYAYPYAQGTISVGGLLNQDLTTKQRRYHWDISHRFANRYVSPQHGHWQITVRDNYISDDEYYSDFSFNTQQVNRRYLPRTIAINYAQQGLSLGLGYDEHKQLYDYQEAATRTPHMTLSYQQAGNFGFSVDGGYTKFKYDDLQADERFTQDSKLSVSSKFAGGYVGKVSGGVKSAWYKLNNHYPHRSCTDNDFSWHVPYTQAELGKSSFVHTPKSVVKLEQKIIYSRSAYKDQSCAPIYDTKLRDEVDFRYTNWNDFVGADRAAHSNHSALINNIEWYRQSSSDTLEPYLSVQLQSRYLHQRRKDISIEDGYQAQRGFDDHLASWNWRPLKNISQFGKLRYRQVSKKIDRYSYGAKWQQWRNRLSFERAVRSSYSSYSYGADWALQNKLWLQSSYTHFERGSVRHRTSLAFSYFDDCDCWQMEAGMYQQKNRSGSTNYGFRLGFYLGGINRDISWENYQPSQPVRYRGQGNSF